MKRLAVCIMVLATLTAYASPVVQCDTVVNPDCNLPDSY